MGIKSSYKDGGLDDALATQQRADENRRLEDKSEESGEFDNSTTADGDRTRSYIVGKDGKIEMSGDNAGFKCRPT